MEMNQDGEEEKEDEEEQKGQIVGVVTFIHRVASRLSKSHKRF